MIPLRARLWGEAIAATMLAAGRRVGPALCRLRQGAAVLVLSVRGALGRQRDLWRARQAATLAAFARHRHGTWLLAFCLLFTLLWLLAGWAGMANGVWRGLLVGIATPVAVSALFPLQRPAQARVGSR
jgi:hypothetical protein